MPSGFPGSIDSFTNPLSSSALNSPSHSGQHSDLNDAVNKVETYMGLTKVIPTSATNGTVGATGTITVGNAVSSVTANGAFSARFNAYRVLISGLVGSAGSDLRLTFGATTTGYYGSYTYVYYATGASSVYGQNNTANLYIGGVATNDEQSISLDIFNPYLAKRTGVNGLAYGNAYSFFHSGVLFNTTSYTAFTVATGSGTLTGGTIAIYGYAA